MEAIGKRQSLSYGAFVLEPTKIASTFAGKHNASPPN